MILSICIPTYKRVKELKRALESIDILNFKNQVEIIVCENCSENRTRVREIVEEFKNNMKFSVSYYENETNIGYDRNLKRLIDYAIGDYIVFLSDDDQFVPGMLDDLCQILITRAADVIIYGFKYLNYGFSGNTKIVRYDEKTFDLNNSKLALEENFEKLSLISGLCGKREKLCKYLDFDKFDGTLFNQVFIFGSVIVNGGTVALLDKSLVCYCGDGQTVFGEAESEKDISNKISSLNMQKRNLSNISIANYFDEEYNLNIAKRIEPLILKGEYSNLLIMRKLGIYEFVKYHKVNIANYSYIPKRYYFEYFIIYMFGSKLVGCALNFLMKCRRIVLSIKNKMKGESDGKNINIS